MAEKTAPEQVTTDRSKFGLTTPQIAGSSDDPIHLQVECVYIPIIGNIDITNNTFDVKVDLDLTWKATDQDLICYNEDPHSYKPTFVPNLVFVNSMAFVDDRLVPLKGDVIYQIREEKEDKRNYIRQRFIGTMVNNFEIESFPFDVQNLVLAISISFYPAKQACFKIRPDGEPFIYVPKKYTATPGFELTRTFGGVIEDSSDYSVLLTVVQIKRIRRPYIFRILMPLLSLNIATFSIYALDSLEEKINILITTLLSFVGMIYILSTLIPIAGKSNIFDRYAMFSVVLCVGGIFLLGWETSFRGRTFYIHTGMSGLLHLYILVSMVKNNSNQHAKMKCQIHDVSKKYLEMEDLKFSLKSKHSIH